METQPCIMKRQKIIFFLNFLIFFYEKGDLSNIIFRVFDQQNNGTLYILLEIRTKYFNYTYTCSSITLFDSLKHEHGVAIRELRMQRFYLTSCDILHVTHLHY